jgi:toxin FitB
VTGWLIDTNVVSEWVKPRPHRGVIEWLADVDEDRVHLSVVTLVELRDGVDRLPTGRRRARLPAWLSDELPLRFEGRVLGVDVALADAWGLALAHGRMAGRPIGSMDACLAATALHHDLTLVTRNVRDFSALDVKTVDPWRTA